MIRLMRITDGYRYGDYIIRKDQPVGEWDLPSGTPIWYVLTIEQDGNNDGLPDAIFEADTLKACRTHVEKLST